MKKILLTCIVKDDKEYDNVKRMLETFMPHMHGCVVLFNGLSKKYDKITELFKKYNAHILTANPETHPKIYGRDATGTFFANFAAARQVTFDYADTLEGYDWYSWADVDDILLSGKEIQPMLEQAEEKEVDSIFCTYWYSLQIREDGSFNQNDVYIEQIRERFLRPKKFKWVSRLHEVAVSADDAYQVKNAPYDFNTKEGRELVWVHLTDRERADANMDRNLRILELQAKEENHKDPRTLFYLAKTYYDAAKPGSLDIAEQLLLEYLEGSGWREERGNACAYLGEIWKRRKNYDKAIEWYFRAMEYAPYLHLHWLYLAECYTHKGMYEESNFYLDMACKMDPPSTRTTIGNPLDVKFFAASLQMNRFIREQNLPKALEWAKIRKNLVPATSDHWLDTLEEQNKINTMAHAYFDYARFLKDQGKLDQLKNLLPAALPEWKNEAFYQLMVSELLPPKEWAEDEIAYYASFGAQHFEEWGPDSLEKGIGGSETAVIELARQWAKKGKKVTVYCDTPEEKEWEGVMFKHFATLNWNDTFNVLILWRSPHLLAKEIKAKTLVMDLHDVASQMDWTDEKMKKIDKVFFKSEYHRKMLPKLPDSKAVIVSNGISV